MKRCFGCMEEYEEELTKCPHCGYEEGEKPENALHMSPGIVLQERYLVGKVIGYGGFGVTYVGWDPVLDTKIAIKEYLPSEFATRGVGQTEVTVFSGDKQEQFKDGMVKFVEEARKLAQFSSEPGIVKIFDSFECNNTAYIIMEYLDGETIAEYLKRGSVVSEEETIEMMKPLMRSLVQVHKAGIIHRDIAPDNIFMTKDHKIKLIDFGAARYATTSHSRSLTVIIKPGYSPEEQYRSRGDQGAHTDVYSLAATMYRMLTGETPPDALERRAYFENSKKDILKPISSFTKEISKNHETAILNALNIRVEDRTPDMETFLQELESTEKVHRRSYRIRKIDLYKWPTWLKIAASAATACLVLFIVLFLTGVIGFDAHLKTDFMLPEGKTRVPSVVNNDFDKAEEKLEAANLIMLVSGREYSDSIPFNYVLYQDIDPGKVVDENSILRLTISSGEMMRIMPDVQGYELQKAKEQLEGLGISVVTESEISNIFAEGCVVSQSIEPKKSIEKGTEVTLVVSSGQGDGFTEQNVTIPDLRGMTLEEAMKSASTNQFFIKVTERKFDKDHEEGEIIEQSPAPGTASNSQAVEVTVSLGYDNIDVPYVLYFEREEAENFLISQGLEVDFKEDYNNDVEAGLVIEQSPEANTAAKPGTKVTLTISKGPKPFSMPDVRKMMEEEAEKALDPYGLIVKETLKINNSQKKGMVLEQSVKKGTQMKKGDTVTLTICDHDPVMKVPDLSDMTKAEAQKALNNTGLVAKFTEEYDDTIESGKVISQDPEPGSNLKDGGTVKVSISKGKDPTRKAPTSPVGSGYTDYLSIDIDNDGEKEMLQLYNDYGTTLRIYETETDYTEFDVTAGSGNHTYICYDSNKNRTCLYLYTMSGISDILNGGTIYNGLEYNTSDGYYVFGKKVTEEEYNRYVEGIQHLYYLEDGMFITESGEVENPTKKAPTSPVGSGYTDYLSIDIDNDGEKEMLQLYNNGGEIFLRIYKTQTDYTEIDVTPGADSGTDICYDPNRGGTYLYSMGNFGITDLLTDREITSMDFKDDSWVERVYYVSGKEVSEDTYYDYMDRVEILYSVYPAGTFGQ